MFEIFTVKGRQNGHIGICPQPARDNDLDTDLEVINAWQPDVVLTLTTQDEFPEPPKSLPNAFSRGAFEWIHLPITDFSTPLKSETTLFLKHLDALHARLMTGERVLIHCKGGQGRSGMMALALMIKQEEPADIALARLRDVRANAVETQAQYLWASNIT